MGIQVAAIAKRYMLQMQAQAAKTQGSSRVREGYRADSFEKIFFTKKPAVLSSRFFTFIYSQASFSSILPKNLRLGLGVRICVVRSRDDDFIGVQNYTRELVGPEGSVTVPDGADITQCGYEFYPEGLEHVIRKVAKDFKGDILPKNLRLGLGVRICVVRSTATSPYLRLYAFCHS